MLKYCDNEGIKSSIILCLQWALLNFFSIVSSLFAVLWLAWYYGSGPVLVYMGVLFLVLCVR